jgi:hypothetical protein
MQVFSDIHAAKEAKPDFAKNLRDFDIGDSTASSFDIGD